MSKTTVTWNPLNQRELRQEAVEGWVRDTFGDQAMALDTRIRRFFEEAVELSQAVGLGRESAHKIVELVYARPEGDPEQELGGVGSTLLAVAAALGISAEIAEQKEVDRVRSKDPQHFRERDAAKRAAGFGG